MAFEIPRPEHPRPDFERTQWLNLNGPWEFEFDDNEAGEEEKWFVEKSFTRSITVPFCFQSKLSGIHDTGMHEVFWYRKSFDIPENFYGKRVLLNFGAVDYYAKIWVNGEYAGSHKGGNCSFRMDITRFLTKGTNSLVVRVEDRYDSIQPRGKQYWRKNPDRCWYTATSGIWQTVWLEAVGEVYIEKIRLTPDIEKKTVGAEVYLNKNPEAMKINIKVSFSGAPALDGTFMGKVNADDEKRLGSREFLFDINDKYVRFTIDIQNIDDVDNIHLWSPEMPNLYDIELALTTGGEKTDSVKSYFGMRKISVKGDLILLNNRPYYQKLILDQGYWPDSLLTPPSDEDIRFDVEMTKKMGFNGARKHQKMEDPRYYYWADKLGLLVWGEMPSAYNFNVQEMENITTEWIDFMNRDYNHPCIVTWVPLNESWGVREIYANRNQQNFARSLYYLTKAMDSTRLVSTNDGWEQVDTDIVGVHDYAPWAENFIPKYNDKETLFKGNASSRMLFCENTEYHGEPVLVTEYGGIAFESDNKGNWGYNGVVKDEKSFLERYASVTGAIMKLPYVRGYCYTQLTDVMQEVNGLMTETRKLKVDIEEIRRINS